MSSLKKILVPLDGSVLAEKTLASAAVLAKATGATLLLLRVQEPLVHMADQELYEQVAQLKEDTAHKYLNGVASRSEMEGITRELLTVKGAVAESIIECAVENKVDLIMMSSHGRSGISRWIYGSVAEKLMRQAPCAMIVLQSKADKLLFSQKRILVTLDGSALAEQAIEPALMIAQAVGAELVLLRVVGVIQVAIDSVDPLVMMQDLRQLEEREMVEAQAYLQRMQNSLTGSNTSVQIEVLNGPIAETILAYTDGHKFDLVAMSSHGRSGVSRWFYGSVTEKVLRGSCCAMLITRGSGK